MQQTPDSVFSILARITDALSSPSRLKLLDRLVQGEQTVDDLAAAAGLSISNTSRQLRLLSEARLASVRRDGRHVYYQIDNDRVMGFWFALRSLARHQLDEFDRLVSELVDKRDGFDAVRREELLAKMQTGEVVVLDVRPEPEYRAGHIAGALSIPLEQLEERLSSIPAGKEVVAYCRGPYCVLSVDAVQALRARGVAAYRLEDGLPEWRAAGLPTTTA